MFMRKILLLFAIAGAAYAGPVTWSLSNALFNDGGTAVGSFVFDASTNTVLSYSIATSGGDTNAFPAFLFQNGSPNNTGATVYTSLNIIDFGSTFTNGNLNGLQLRLASVLSLTDAGGVVNFDLNNFYLGECFNCSPNRAFVSGQMIGEAAVPEPSTVALTLLPLALGVLTVRRLRHRP